MSEAHGDEGLIDVSDVEYNDDDLTDGFDRAIELNNDRFHEVLGADNFGSEEWKIEVAALFMGMHQFAVERAQDIAEENYCDVKKYGAAA